MKHIVVCASQIDVLARVLVKELKASAERYGFVLKDWFSEVGTGDAWVESIVSEIANSNGVLVFLERASPNVYLETGYAMGMGKPILVVTQKLLEVPLLLRSQPLVSYDITDPHWLEPIFSWIESLDRIHVRSAPSDLKGMLGLLEADPAGFELISLEAFTGAVAKVLLQSNVKVRNMGIDGEDELGHDLSVSVPKLGKWLVQVKKQPLNAKAQIRDVAKMAQVVLRSKASGGIIVSPSGFTASAADFAERSSAGTLVLLGPVELAELSRGSELGKFLGGRPSP